MKNLQFLKWNDYEEVKPTIVGAYLVQAKSYVTDPIDWYKVKWEGTSFSGLNGCIIEAWAKIKEYER